MKSTLNPDWVMVGYRHENGRYRILASTSLGHAELDYLARSYHFADVADMVDNLKPQYDLRAVLNSYILAEGDSYIEALGALMGGWVPSQPTGARVASRASRNIPSGKTIDAEWDGAPQHAWVPTRRGASTIGGATTGAPLTSGGPNHAGGQTCEGTPTMGGATLGGPLSTGGPSPTGMPPTGVAPTPSTPPAPPATKGSTGDHTTP